MYPEQLAARHRKDGTFVRIADLHLDVPLFWQCWKLDSPLIQTITGAVQSAAGNLRRHRR
jgi:LysR family transcriptional regulator (chromosome initiation inhibitor)